MTPEEQQQVSAGMAYMERLVTNLARDGVNATMASQSLANQLKAVTEERDKLKAELDALKPKPENNVAQIMEQDP